VAKKPKRLCGNYRHLKTVVEPIRHSRQLGQIWTLLKDNPRDLLLFVVGTNSGLRVNDIVHLRVRQVRDVPEGGVVRLTESKTGKTNVLVINKAIHRVLHAYLDQAQYEGDDRWLFVTRYGTRLTSLYAGRLVQSWCKAIGLEGSYGAHTLRKTWAYHMRVKFKTDWSLITERLNHSNPAITRRYLGITQDEVVTLLQNIVE
jgi:integrase